MKNRTVFPLLLVLVFSSARAGWVDVVGVKAGPVFSTVNWKYKNGYPLLDMQMRVGFSFGVQTESFTTKHFSLQTEFQYIPYGGVSSALVSGSNGQGDEVKVDYRWDHLVFSPALKFRLPRKHLSPYAYLGPSLRYLWRDRYQFDDKEPEYQEFSDLAIGLNAGLGMEYRFGKMSAIMECQLPILISPVYEVEADQNNVGMEIRGWNYQLMLGLRFHFLD